MSQEYCVKCMRKVVEGGGCTCGFDKSKYDVESYHLIPGSILNGRYLVGIVLGEGGFGITYVGMDLVLRRKVAIKEYFLNGYANRTTVTSTDIITKPGEKEEVFNKYMESFLAEGQTMARFANEKSIVSIYDFFKANNTAYIVMEFLEGSTLGNYCKNNGYIKYDEVIRIFTPIISDLGEIHREDVIHRDISPDNIIINPSGEAKLLDFGAARSFEKEVQKTMSIILKPGYAPVEQYSKKGNQGPWTDIYALCSTIYYCMTGLVPENAIERYQIDEVKPVSEVVSGCPEYGSLAIMKGMAPRMEDRYQSMRELLEALMAGEKVPPPDDIDIPIAIDDDLPKIVDHEEERRRMLKLTERSLPQQYSWDKIAWNQSSMDPTGLYRVNYASEIGDIVTFSYYNWIVLAKQGNRVMLMSEDPIVMLPYDVLEGQVFRSVTWGESYLRKWLNTEFFHSFNDFEKSQIQLISSINNVNDSNRSGIGQETIDSVYMLSREEALAYGVNRDKVSFNGKKCSWWLRNCGLSSQRIAVVKHNGKVDDNGAMADGLYGVRPVIMISF